jgi:DNA polymerase-3 subunit gamma/tau
LEYVALQENVKAESEALNVIAQKADGGMRDALSVFDQIVSFSQGNITYQSVIENLNVLDYEYYFRLTGFILQGNIRECLLLLDEILRKGFDGQHIITGLASFFRDVLVCKDPQTIVLFEVGDAVKEKYLQLAPQCSDNFLYKVLELSNECDLNYRISRNKRLLTELLLIRLCRLNHPSDQEDDKKKTIVDLGSASLEQTQSTGEKKGEPLSPHTILSNLQKENFRKENTSANAKPITIAIKKQLMNGEREENAARSEKEVMNEPFTQKDLINVWKLHADKEDDIHLKNTMLNFSPLLKEDYLVEIEVSNPTQQTKLNEKIKYLYDDFSLQLKNTFIRFEIKIKENNSNQTPFTEKEKYQYMASQNPNLDALVKEFDLRLD